MTKLNKRQTQPFSKNEGVAKASAGPYANHLHLAADRQQCQHLTTQFLQLNFSSTHPDTQPTMSKHRRQLKNQK